GELRGGIEAWATGGRRLDTVALVPASRAEGRVIDVRQAVEFAVGHLPGAVHAELGAITSVDLPAGHLTLMCGHGERAMTAARLPVPLLIIWAPTWGWVIVANVLLGINQGLTWSTTVIMKIDLAGPKSRGLAMGFNEAAGYGAVAVTAFATGLIAERWGLRPEP